MYDALSACTLLTAEPSSLAQEALFKDTLVSFLFLLTGEISSNFSLELKGWSWWNEHFLGCNSISHSNGSKTDPLKAKVTPHYSLCPLDSLISDSSWTGQAQRPTQVNKGSPCKRDELWQRGWRRHRAYPRCSSVQACHYYETHEISAERTVLPINTLLRKQVDFKGRWQPTLMKPIYTMASFFFCAL